MTVCPTCGRPVEPGPTARRNDPDTSHKAGREARFRAGTYHAMLLAAHVRNDVYGTFPDGMTDEEAAALSGVDSRSCWWKRLGDLRRMGLIADTGIRRDGSTGHPRIVSHITPLGREYHARLQGGG